MDISFYEVQNVGCYIKET